MRNTFFDLIRKRMAEDDSIFILAADMGLGLLNPFMEQFPDRFLNVGIAESNMIGVAAGLCNAGFRPFCYTISNFLVQRAYEQIRNDICIHSYPITLVGTSTGYDNGLLGPTHQVIDDMGCMKILPGMKIYTPSSTAVIGTMIREIIEAPSPAYVRIGKGSPVSIEPDIYPVNTLIRKADTQNVLVVSYGTVLSKCLSAWDIEPSFSVYRLDCLELQSLGRYIAAFEGYGDVVVIEDHFASSGLFGSICQKMMEKRMNVRVHSISPAERYEYEVGTDVYLAERYGYSPEKIVQFIRSLS